MVVEVSNLSEVNLSKAVHQNLVAAKCENRIIIGLSQVVRSLSKIPDEGFFCIMAPPVEGDSATHMLEVLLQAYCYENDIYLIMVDSSEKLSRLLGSQRLESCALITTQELKDEDKFKDFELTLVDFCEQHWENPVKPVIKLPDK